MPPSDAGSEPGSGQTMACPECDSSDIRRRTGLGDADPDWRCAKCGFVCESPNRRPSKTGKAICNGLARKLDDADPGDLVTDGGTPRSESAIARIKSKLCDDGGLDEDEVGLVVVELYEHGLSFGEIAQCFPRDRRWVRETYEEHPKSSSDKEKMKHPMTDGGTAEHEADLEYAEPIYQRELLEKAKEAQEPVTEIEVSDKGRTTRVHAIQEYDGVAWRVMIRHYEPSDDPPSVTFAKSHHNSEVKVMRDWSALATGRLGGPQDLPSWESLFTVFNSALGVYNREVRNVERR